MPIDRTEATRKRIDRFEGRRQEGAENNEENCPNKQTTHTHTRTHGARGPTRLGVAVIGHFWSTRHKQ